VAGSYEHSDETSGPIKDWKALNRLKDFQLVKEESTAWKELVI
jgi:hypothetical protein